MGHKLKAVFSIMLTAVTLFCACAFSSCKEKSLKNRDAILLEDFNIEMTVPKAEFSLEELEANDYMVWIILKFTNNTGIDLYYADDDSEEKAYVSFKYGLLSLVTHKDGVRYEPGQLFTDCRVEFKDFTADLFTSPMFVPSKIAAGESFTVNMSFNYLYPFLAKDGEAKYIYLFDTVSDNSLDKHVSYNTDFALSDDENYKDLGTYAYYIFGTSGYRGDDMLIVEGYYSFVFNNVMYVNCIKIG